MSEELLLKGRYSDAVVYTYTCEAEAQRQIMNLLNQPMMEGAHPRFMPDVHAGKGCTVGTTMHIRDKVVPNLVGVDIGCGMEVTYIKEKSISLPKLDAMLHAGKLVPSGFSKRAKAHEYIANCHLEDLYCAHYVDLDNARLSLGSLGGGNHFIEVDRDAKGNYLLVVHSGSRHLGLEVCKFYQDLAIASRNDHRREVADFIKKCQLEGHPQDIEAGIAKIKEQPCPPKELAWLEGEDLEHYLHDMKITQEFAMWSRRAMSQSILDYMGWTKADGFTTIHNYIDTEARILRKGAISARYGEKVIIPLSMKDGSIIAIGKGNAEWNYSAPHGAGRIMSRSQAKRDLTVEKFEREMKGIYTTCVNEKTLDESPMAYKPAKSIIENVVDTVKVLEVVKPVYNFKAN